MSSIFSTYEATDSQGQAWRLEMIYDHDAQSPRDNQENLGTMIYAHRRYSLGDERINVGSFDEYLASINLTVDDVVSLPMYLYDHSGLALSTKDFNDQFDSGCVGSIFVSLDKIKQEYGNHNLETIERVKDILRAEVQEMHEFVSGNTYGMRLTPMATDPDEPTISEEVWGFLGADPRTNGMISHLDPDALAAFTPVFERELGALPGAEPQTQPAPARSAPRPR